MPSWHKYDTSTRREANGQESSAHTVQRVCILIAVFCVFCGVDGLSQISQVSKKGQILYHETSDWRANIFLEPGIRSTLTQSSNGPTKGLREYMGPWEKLHTNAYLANYFRPVAEDGGGKKFLPNEGAAILAGLAKPPIYPISATYAGKRMIARNLLEAEAVGHENAELALRILRGERVDNILLLQGRSNGVMADWRQLRGGRMDERKLPFSAVVRFRSLWKQYKWYVLGSLTAIGVQLALIIVLLAEMRRRKRSDLTVKNLSGKLIRAEEEERKRIARELHDDVAQRLSLLSIELDLMQRQFPDDHAQARQSLQEPLQQVREILTDIHNMSHQLHSQKLQLQGLGAALKDMCQQLARQYRVEVDCIADEIPAVREDLALCFYRVAQEALSNSVKHSRSPRVELRLTARDRILKMRIKDYGVGFDAGACAKGLGLAAMRERVRFVGGKLLIISHAGKGTELIAQARLQPSAVKSSAASLTA